MELTDSAIVSSPGAVGQHVDPSEGNDPAPSFRMDRVAFAGVELEYTVRGAGEPVLLVHAGIFADWFVPVLAEPRLTAGYQLIHYHRVGYAGSSRPTER
jgi:hypothetical protein